MPNVGYKQTDEAKAKIAEASKLKWQHYFSVRMKTRLAG
jgi:hypothetical protein